MKNLLFMLAVLIGAAIGSICAADYRDEIAAIEAETAQVAAEGEAAIAAADRTIADCNKVCAELAALNATSSAEVASGWNLVLLITAILVGLVLVRLGCN